MYCMKCGTETRQTQSFCDRCLAIMAERPVKPDAVVHLPVRPSAAAKKPAPRKRAPTAEEQLTRMRSVIKWMSLAVTCLVVALAVTITLLVHAEPADQPEHGIGQNYNTVDTANRSD